MTEVELAKLELLGFAKRHDAERAQRRKPVKMAAFAGLAGLLASRLLIGGGKRAVRKGIGGRIMGAVFIARLALSYAPVIYRAFHEAKRVYRTTSAARVVPRPVVIAQRPDSPHPETASSPREPLSTL